MFAARSGARVWTLFPAAVARQACDPLPDPSGAGMLTRRGLRFTGAPLCY